MYKKILIIYVTLMVFSSVFTINSITKESNIDEIPEFVNIGDILFMDFNEKVPIFGEAGPYNDHIAIYIGDNKFVHAYHTTGVDIKDYDYFKNNFNNLVFAYIKNADSSQKINASEFAESKVGQKYQYLPQFSNKGSNNRWYPAELIWSAYYSQGIDIDLNEWEKPLVVSIQEIIDDSDIETYTVNSVPDYVKRGDIIFMDMKNYNTYWAIPGYSNDHAGIYLGPDFKDGNYFIHASSPGVSYVKFDDYHFYFENFTYFYVDGANESLIDSAIKWAENLVGLKYQCFFPQFASPKFWYNGMMELGTKCADPNNTTIKTANRFYCSELVWAAYYNQGIDIDKNGWESVNPDISNFTISKIAKILWKFFGFSFIYVDCLDMLNSEKTIERFY